MEAIQNMVNQVSEQIAELADSDLVVGEAIEAGDVTLVPLSRVSLGFGAGGGQGSGDMEQLHAHKKGKGPQSPIKGQGSGAGGGGFGSGKVRPVAVIIFDAEGVRVEKVEGKPSLLDKLFEKIPELIERFDKKD